MKKYIVFCFLSCVAITSNAQFVQKAEIEYEVRTNIKKTMGNSTWAQMMKDNLPD